MTRVGELNRRLTLEAPVESADGAGGTTRSFAAVATLWASLQPVSARESLVAAQLGATITHRIVVRYRDDLTIRHRFREGARVLRIVALREQQGRSIEIDADERED